VRFLPACCSAGERREDATIQYNKYFWKADALGDYLKKNNLDALLLVVISGITRPEKIYGSAMLDSFETDYNYLIMTAQMLDSRGVVIWEYPNFRQRSLSYEHMLNLQYPDFEYAKANMSSTPPVRFKTMEGIKRALDRRRLDFLRRETGDVDIYLTQFEEIASLIELERPGKPLPPAAPVQQAPAKE